MEGSSFIERLKDVFHATDIKGHMGNDGNTYKSRNGCTNDPNEDWFVDN